MQWVVGLPVLISQSGSILAPDTLDEQCPRGYRYGHDEVSGLDAGGAPRCHREHDLAVATHARRRSPALPVELAPPFRHGQCSF
jgi:hypothetical protein